MASHQILSHGRMCCCLLEEVRSMGQRPACRHPECLEAQDPEELSIGLGGNPGPWHSLVDEDPPVASSKKASRHQAEVRRTTPNKNSLVGHLVSETIPGIKTYFHDGPVATKGHRDALLVLECNTPNCLALRNKLADEVSGLEIPDLDTAVTTTAHDAGIVKLQARNTVIVRRQPVDRHKFGK